MIKEFYKPNQIIFDRDSVIWVLHNLLELRNGVYPQDPADTGYTDAPINKKTVKAKANFILPVEIAAEIDTRLDRCGLDGKLVYGNYVDDIDIDRLAKAADLDFYDVVKRINKALNYISSGPNRRWHDTDKRKGVSYKDWIRA